MHRASGRCWRTGRHSVTTVDPAALEAWQSAIGRSDSRRERCAVESLRRYALAVGSSAEVEAALPPLPHWAFFLPQPEDAQIGRDGHPKRGAFLPAISLPRRMFAAADIRFEAPLVLGEDAELTSTITGLNHKAGASGDLVFLEVDHVIRQHMKIRIRERQTYVYRAMGAAMLMPVPGDAAPEGEIWTPGPANLFRFSAATFNSHRIHYDLPYTQAEEGYPALVVQGPFTAARLASLAERRGPLKRFSFRAQAPLFLGQAITLQHSDGELRAIRCDGAIAMTGKVEYA